MTIEQALSKLFSLHKFGIKLGLENTLDLLEYIGNPQKKLKTIHVAGSNGKGSTASFIASILTDAGYKVGLYTSPHFVRFNERIRINGVEIDDERVTKFIERLDEYIEKKSPTFFELTTALAFEYFAEEAVDYAVIETGLGGRLDSTNVITPLVSVITTISLEHTNILGETLELIAAEKAGIIKKGVPVICGLLPEAAEKVIRQKSLEQSAEFYSLKDYFIERADYAFVSSKAGRLMLYTLPLQGNHQYANSGLAVMAAVMAVNVTKPAVILKGLQNTVKNTGLQGRYEVYSEKPRVIFDSAHNPDGVKIFLREFEKEYRTYSERILIFGVMKDKNIKEMLYELEGYFDKVLFTSINIERSATIPELMELAGDMKFKFEPLEQTASFITNFLHRGEKACLVILGSMYLLGDIKAKIG